jgi:hypothetical protein
LKLTIEVKLKKLRELRSLYFRKGIKSGLTPSQQKRYDYIGLKYRALYERFNHSTLQCGSGAACYSFHEAKKHGFNPQDRPIDLDLVWVPWLRRWFCLKCYILKRQGEMTYEDFDDPIYRKWVKEEFGI